MPTAKGGYFIDGERVPGVTTVLGKFKDPGGLMYWAYQQGIEGKDYRQARDEAADAGTVAHALVEAWIKGESEISTNAAPEIQAKAQNAFEQFLRWAEQSKLTVVQTEVQMLSRKHRYGGTMDAISMDGSTCVLDWKSSNSVHGEYLAQLAAYGELWNENNPENPITGGYHLVRFDKEHASFDHRWWGDLSDGLEYFLLLRRAYDLEKVLKRKAGK